MELMSISKAINDHQQQKLAYLLFSKFVQVLFIYGSLDFVKSLDVGLKVV
jgi:hypothetical protein